MFYFSSFAIGGFVPSAAIAGVLLLVGLEPSFTLVLKDPQIIKPDFDVQMVIFITLINKVSLWI